MPDHHTNMFLQTSSVVLCLWLITACAHNYDFYKQRTERMSAFRRVRLAPRLTY